MKKILFSFIIFIFLIPGVNASNDYDQSIGHEWPEDWNNKVLSISYDDYERIELNNTIKSYFENYGITMDQAVSLFDYAFQKQKEIDKCNYYVITYGSSYAFGYNYGVWLNCFEKESDIDTYFTIKSYTLSNREDFIVDFYNEFDSTVGSLNNAHFYYYSGDVISERVRSLSDASSFSSFSHLTIDDVEHDIKGGLNDYLTIIGAYSNLSNYRYYVPANDDNGWKFYKYFYLGDTKITNGSIVDFNESAEPEVYPSITSIKISENVDEFDSILTQTYKFEWDIFDSSKYDYYFSYDNVDYAVMSEKSFNFTFTDNGTIYFKVENKTGEVLYTYYLTVKDIGSYVNDESLNSDDYFLGDFTDHQDTSDVLDENTSTIGDYLQWWKDKFSEFIDSKFGIITQINEIYNTYKNFSVVEGSDVGFGYVENSRDRFFSCNIGNLVWDNGNYGKFECFPVKHDNLPFLIEEGKTFYLVSFNLKSTQNFISFGRVLIMILFGTFTVLKCYKLIIQFIDEMKVGGV